MCQHYRPEPFNVHETCEELVRRGHEVTVLTGLPNYPEGEVREEYRHGRRRDEVVGGVRVLRVPIVARGVDLKGVNKLRRVANYLSFPLAAWATRAAEGGDYDLVVCFQFSPVLMALPALRIARKKGIPCLVWSFDLWPEDLLTGGLSRGGVPYRAMRRVSRKIYRAADMVAVTSPGFKEYFEDQLGLCGLRMEWLPQYAEGFFERLGADPGPAREGGPVVFTFAGNVGGNQSVETVVRAASLLKGEGVVVKVAGSGSRLGACKELAAELGADNVEFLGRLPVESMPVLYGASDAMLLTLSKPSGESLVPVHTIPRKFQSYIAAGKPVVCAVDGAVAGIVRESGCGVTCAAGDPEALAGAMRSFAGAGRAKRAAMADAARDLYRRDYSRERHFARLAQIMEELTGIGD